MTEYAQLETPEAVRAALLEGRPVEILSKFQPCSWWPLDESWTVERIAQHIAAGYQFRAPLPAVQASDAESDAALIARCERAGMRWIPPECEGDDIDDGRPGMFDLCELGAIRSLLAATPAPIAEQNNGGEHPAGLDECPITGRKFWGNMEHPELGVVATYGGPYDTYTIPVRGEDDELRCERFDHDRDEWIEGGEPVGYFNSEQPDATPAPPEKSKADGDLLARLGELADRWCDYPNFANDYADELRALIDGTQK